jgi:hypothetical protein
MRQFLSRNYTYVLIVVGAIVFYVLMVDLMKPSNGMTKEDLKKIEQIDKDINLLIENQKKLDESINEYKNEIKKIYLRFINQGVMLNSNILKKSPGQVVLIV